MFKRIKRIHVDLWSTLGMVCHVDGEGIWCKGQREVSHFSVHRRIPFDESYSLQRASFPHSFPSCNSLSPLVTLFWFQVFSTLSGTLSSTELLPQWNKCPGPRTEGACWQVGDKCTMSTRATVLRGQGGYTTHSFRQKSNDNTRQACHLDSALQPTSIIHVHFHWRRKMRLKAMLGKIPTRNGIWVFCFLILWVFSTTLEDMVKRVESNKFLGKISILVCSLIGKIIVVIVPRS